ncbi:RHS repeat-associated core domain-containing protein [Belliella kenyensis]|uniref:RHS repeat-associated core domain-containing protein n=1 Tax=Belliella kenyensis TaxID=1472724 RepID=A0ABV8EKC4_9BACT|nr:RHS repeat-associated core domain-containing protein [Belliella kenyensis]MCH7403865.1 RHS repeat-associated core domain-containing protein [Belliella kenyensis]MDN3604874.1 RHS repeat-associated core domain-containing protein [Belliella kenyensis]
MYIYFSNENPTPVEVFFDDFKVTHTNSNIVQKDDYYPFGMTFNSYSAPSGVGQKFKFNGKEREELTGWDDFGARMYMSDLGRWGVVDPLADIYLGFSPYNFTLNNPIKYIDPNGMWVEGANGYSTNDPDEMRDIMRLLEQQQQRKEQKEEDKKNRKNQEAISGSGIALGGVGTTAYLGERLSSNILGSRSGYTSGKILENSPFNYSKQRAGNIKTGLKLTGFALTIYGIADTEFQFDQGNISDGRRRLNHLNNASGLAYPILAVPIAVGDYVGQTHSEQITSIVAEPGGFVFESMKRVLQILGIPTEKK